MNESTPRRGAWQPALAKRRARRPYALACALALVGAATGSLGCATYSERMLAATRAVEVGAYGDSLSQLNEALRVGSEAELPSRWGSSESLTVLERAIVLQSLERFEESARDLSAAEQQIELLEFSFDGVGALSKYLYSDSSRKYRAPPSERLALNAINLLNYLALGDLEGAAVEARRFQVNREYLSSLDVEAPAAATLGAYLAGLVFEKLGEGDRALRYYEEALAGGALNSLRAPTGRLARHNPFRGPQLRSLLASAGKQRALQRDEGEVLVVLSLGRVPHKVPERLPIGAAIGYVGARVTFDARVFERAALKVLVYPELRATPSQLGTASVLVDGGATELDLVTNFASAVAAEYEAIKPQIIAAGLTRLVARAGIAEGARALGNQESGLLGSVLALATEAALVAADRPDTRSWTLLPGQIFAARIPVGAGEHRIEVSFSSAPESARTLLINVPAGGVTTVVVTEPR